MPKDDSWHLAQKNASQIDGMCVLCWLGISGGTGRFEQCHHIKPKQMGGTKDEFVLKDRRNMAPACQAHHERFQPNRVVWVAAMEIALGFCYDDTPLKGYQIKNPAGYLQRFKKE